MLRIITLDSALLEKRGRRRFRRSLGWLPQSFEPTDHLVLQSLVQYAAWALRLHYTREMSQAPVLPELHARFGHDEPDAGFVGRLWLTPARK